MMGRRRGGSHVMRGMVGVSRGIPGPFGSTRVPLLCSNSFMVGCVVVHGYRKCLFWCAKISGQEYPLAAAGAAIAPAHSANTGNLSSAHAPAWPGFLRNDTSTLGEVCTCPATRGNEKQSPGSSAAARSEWTAVFHTSLYSVAFSVQLLTQ